MAKKKDYDWRKDWDWTDPEDGPASWDDVEVKEIEIDLDKFLLPKEYAYGGGVGHLLEPTQTYHQYHDFTAPMTVGAMVDNMYNRGGRVNYQSGGWNPGVGRDKKGYQKTSPHHSSRDDGPPKIINPPPKNERNDKSTELFTFDEYTGKPMTYADVAAANNFLNFVKTQGGYTMGENAEADALYEAYRTATGKDTYMQDATVDAEINSNISEIDGNTKTFIDRNSTITDLDTGKSTKQLMVETPTNFTQRIVRPSGIMENNIAQPFGAPQSLSVDPYSNNIIGTNLADGGRVGMLSGGLLSKGIMGALEQIKNMDEGNLFSELDSLGKARTIKDALIDRIAGFKDMIKVLKTEAMDHPEIEDIKFEMDEAKDGLKKINEYIKNQPTNRTLQADGGRVGMFMGGDPLTGQALAIYESMNSYGFSDAEIASALQQQGLYTPPGSGTPTPDPTPTPTPGQGGVGDSNDPYPGQIVDQTSFADYQFNKSDYAPGGKLEINPAALGIGFYESGPGNQTLAASKGINMNAFNQGDFNQKKEMVEKAGLDFNMDTLEKLNQPVETGFIESFMGASVPNKMKSTVTMPGYKQFQSVNPNEFRNFMDANIEGIGGNLTRQDLANMYEDYNKFTGRRSNYAGARVPGTVGNLINIIPGIGTVKKVGEGIFGPPGDKSMQSKYGVEGGFGGGNTTFRDEFGLSVIDDNKRLFGKKDRNYLDRMEEQMGKNIDFFGGTRTSLFGGKKLDKTGSSVENFAERWANFDDLDAADQQALINEMKNINSFKAKQMLAYKNRIATEKINKDWQQKQEDIATQKRIDAEKDFVTQDLGVTAADAATSGRGMDHTRGMTSRERGAAASRMGGGSRQAKSGSQKAGGSGRKDKGWGWAHGGPVGVASMFTRRR